MVTENNMKKIIGILALIAVLGALAWTFLPGVRHRAVKVYEKHGGWTPEARKADPVGFLEHAEKKLARDLEALQESRRALAQAQEKIAAEAEKNQGLLQSAMALADKFRTAYREAQESKTWPVEISGANYSEKELVEQVRVILMQKANYEQILKEFESASAAAKEKSEQLVTQTNSTKAALAMLPAKKEVARVSKLTEGLTETLGQVSSLLGENEKALTSTPIRTVEELVGSKQATKAPADPQAEAKAFLEGKE